jgi:hypothetical protein
MSCVTADRSLPQFPGYPYPAGRVQVSGQKKYLKKIFEIVDPASEEGDKEGSQALSTL